MNLARFASPHWARARLFACLTLLASMVSAVIRAEEIKFRPEARESDTALSEEMRVVAQRLLEIKNDAERDKLDNLIRLQLVAGRPAEALKNLGRLRASDPSLANVRWEIFATAKTVAAEGPSFDNAFNKSFRQTLNALSDKDAYRVFWTFDTALPALEQAFREALNRHTSATTTTLPSAAAIELVRRYFAFDAYRSFAHLTPSLMHEDDQRRYVVDKEIAIPTGNGVTICALVVRSRNVARGPALFNFTIYADLPLKLDEARRNASNNFASVVAFTRGKACSPDKPWPYVHDGADAASVIDWISRQSWSDGRVGMYGGSYEGFTAWSATKRMPRALKGIMAGAPVAPGLDVPMEGNVFWNFVYPWPFYTSNHREMDNKAYNDTERWQRLDRTWYASGRAYRDLEKIDGVPNPIFAEWISHPSYDAYWQRMIPHKKEFARISIPVLSTAGYYAGGPGAAVHYFTEHYRYRPNAEHYLVIGPYDHVHGHSGTVGPLGSKTPVISGYELDPVAQLDMPELRYQWFDYVFGRGPRPALLKDKVNHQLMGANVWRHSPSFAAMAPEKLRLHLSTRKSDGHFELATGRAGAPGVVPLVVNLADRSDVDRAAVGGGLLDKAIDVANASVFITQPLQTSVEIGGLFSGHLEFVANKSDFDFSVQLYELTPAGDYVQLAPYWSRASYVGDRTRRRLLTPGSTHRFHFTSARLMSRKTAPGSRIVMTLGVIKETGRQINYGSGKDVSEETIADAHQPLRVNWLTRSYVDLPVRR